MDEFKKTLREIHRLFSFWVAAIGAAVVAAWQLMPANLMTDLFSAYPALKAVAPVLWLGGFVVARAMPQGGAPTDPPAS